MFDGRTLCMPIPGYYNVVLLAFACTPPTLSLAALRERATSLEARHGVEMSQFLERLATTNLTLDGRLVL